MKKSIKLILSIVICFLIIVPINARATETYSDDDMIYEPYKYPIVPDTDEWKALTSLDEKLEATHIPDSILRRLSDDALIETILNYPLAINMFVHNSHEEGYEYVKIQFNGLIELENRGLSDKLYERYIQKSNPPLTRSQNYADWRFEESILELLLSQTIYYDYLEEDKAIELIEIVEEKVNNSEPTVLFFDVLSNPITRNVGLCIYTPNGSAVDVTRMTYEMSQADINNHNNKLAKGYPNAIRERSASRYYNCHSYAWYSQSLNNNIWMENPSKYMSDGSYRLTNAVVTGYKMYYPNGNHSAVIVSAGGSQGGTRVRSKWGSGGLYYHYYNDSPYNSTNVKIYY